MAPLIPPLPASWTFAPRVATPAWERREGIDLGSLGAEWNLIVPPDLEIPILEKGIPGAFGRGGVQRRGELVLRPYRRGGLMRFLVHARYVSPRRFEREWLVHRALWDSGFPTVKPLGYGFRRQGLAFEGVYLTAFMHGRPWPADWTAGDEWIGGLVEALQALSRWGLWSPDLNATNVLLGEGGLCLLDWDRSAFVPATDLLPLYQRRLLRSLVKLGAPEKTSKTFLAAMKDGEVGGR